MVSLSNSMPAATARKHPILLANKTIGLHEKFLDAWSYNELNSSFTCSATPSLTSMKRDESLKGCSRSVNVQNLEKGWQSFSLFEIVVVWKLHLKAKPQAYASGRGWKDENKLKWMRMNFNYRFWWYFRGHFVLCRLVGLPVPPIKSQHIAYIRRGDSDYSWTGSPVWSGKCGLKSGSRLQFGYRKRVVMVRIPTDGSQVNT